MKPKFLLVPGMLLLGGCAVNPWLPYQEAVRCHLDDKGPACDKLYKQVIKADPKLRGIHASYGTHLLLQGNKEEAAKEFQIEQANYPSESTKSIALLLNPAAAAAPAPEPAKPVADTTAKAPAPAAATTPVAAPATKSGKSAKNAAAKESKNAK